MTVEHENQVTEEDLFTSASEESPSAALSADDGTDFQGYPNALSRFVVTRSYLRWREDAGRRERFPEAVDRYVDFIDRNADKPFFLYLPFQNVHGPYTTQQKYFDLYANQGSRFSEGEQTMFGYLTEMDEAVGDIVAAIKAADGGTMYSNTVFVFSSVRSATVTILPLLLRRRGGRSPVMCRIGVVVCSHRRRHCRCRRRRCLHHRGRRQGLDALCRSVQLFGQLLGVRGEADGVLP